LANPEFLVPQSDSGLEIGSEFRTEFTRMLHELQSRDREDGCACPPSRALRRGGRATGHPQGVGPEAYLNGTSQGELVLSDST
jgi:hypothetical protein